MTTIRLRVALASALVTLSLVSPDARTDHVRPRDPDWVAPSEAAAKVNPLAARPETAPGGQKLYRQRCSGCHGGDGRGTERAPDLTAGEVQGQSEGVLFWKVTSGNTRRGMPSFSFLPELQRWQLVLHLRSLSSR